ncbi:MAG TPA: UbiH/UbiF family hydroxylase [Casimicrobiaceae bacterium]|jgi:ubiquinone biosynthesis UbiH/UbiF/VisC/COQ6 family hydroxylase|nr:UbiH/UbiF family hydroxylase [Casimicrobiaceae bacterium]
MPADRRDVLVAGAGLVGLALAAALARSGLTVVLLDRAQPGNAPSEPDTWDPRVYAISPGSAAFLSAIGAWQALSCERIEAIESMRIVGDAGATLQFSAYEMGERALAWIVEERALRAALLPAIHMPGIDVVSGVEFASLTWSADEAGLTLADGRRFAAHLVVGADGVHSWVRHAAGILAEPRSYGQHGVVANFECEIAHHGCARQWFRDDGSVLAWLPLPGPRISIVWSAPDALAQDLLALAPDALAARVAEAGAHALGALRLITPAAAFALSSLRLPTSIAHRMALVGDAAHGVHPLAGQGVNLGFGDARALASVLAERGPIADAGAPILLERFARRRAEPVLAMHAVTDGLVRLFGPRTPWLRALRNAGLSAVDRLPFLKRALAQPAMR